MTDEDKIIIQNEYNEILQWQINEEKKVTAELKASGKYIGGLDTNSADYQYIYDEGNKRINKLRMKYGLPLLNSSH